MAQLVVRDLEESVKEGLRRRARRRGRSLEAEVRDILRGAVARPESQERRLGTRIAARFRRLGRTEEFAESRGHPARAARFAP
jgi:plasmid stability protein